MAPTCSFTSPAATPTGGGPDQGRQVSSVAETTLALGCKTYTCTVAQGGGVTP